MEYAFLYNKGRKKKVMQWYFLTRHLTVSYIGLKEIPEYIASIKEPDFDVFVKEDKCNLSAWSSSTYCNSASDLFALWKNQSQEA